MEHTCKALVLHCIDFRFGKVLKEYLEKEGLLGNCDLVAIAGAAKNIAAPQEATDKEFILRQVSISQRLHAITQVVLINHMDCGAYGGAKAFESKEKEKAHLIDDLKKSAATLKEHFLNIHTLGVLACIDEVGTIAFEEIF